MTKFCEGCPNRGQAGGEFDGVVITELHYEQRATLGRGPIIDSYSGRVAAVCDTEWGVSRPFKVPNTVPEGGLSEFFKKVVDSCPGPSIATKGLVKKRNVITGCGSAMLAQLQINPEIRAQLRQHMQAEANSQRYL